jgi:hypothetical protein
MPKIAPYTPDTTHYFLLDGLRHEKGGWALVYESENEDLIGQEKVGILHKEDPSAEPLVGITNFSYYTNGSDVAYTDMDSLVGDLNTLLDLSN